MRAIILPAFAFVLGAGLFAAPQEAQARFSPEQLQAPTLVDNVQCVTRRIRTVRTRRVTHCTLSTSEGAWICSGLKRA